MQRLGDWSFDPNSARLRRGGEERHLDPKEVSVLAHLAEEAPNPVSVEALLDRSWPGVVVGDNTVHQVVGRLRKALGDSARSPSYIETLPKRGYRLIVFDGSAVPRLSPWRRLQSYVAVLALMGGVAAFLVWTTGRGPYPVVVVQSFTTHSQDPRMLHLARGFEDEVVHAISRNPALAVVNPALSLDAQEASLLVAGRLRPVEENRVRISFRAETAGRTVWTRNFGVDTEAPLADQVAVADQVSVTIAVINDLMRSLEGGTNSDRALVAVLRGRLLAGNDTLEGATEALAYYDQAIRLDPDFAAPYALKAVVYRTFANWYAMDTRKAVARMRDLVDQALARDPDLPLALLVSVAIKLYDGAYAEAEKALQQALAETTDGDLSPKAYAAILLAHCGRFDESLEILDQAIQSNPVHPRYLEHYKAQFLWYARRYGEALTVLDQVLAVTPEDKRAHELRGHVLQSLGRYEEAVEELSWQFPKQQGWMRDAYAKGGVEHVARGYLRHAEDIAQDRVPFTPEQSAWRMYVRGHAMLGEMDHAVAWMEEGWSLGDRWEFFYNRVYPWPGFDELRAHPAFKDLMRRTLGDPSTCPGYRAPAELTQQPDEPTLS
jgi:tetratricopeptide (TPR) repeat protein